MKELKYIWNSILVVTPIVFIEWKQLDKFARAFVIWTFLMTYLSLKANNLSTEVKAPSQPLNNIIVLLTLAAYFIAAIDVRFIHYSDKIPYNPRFEATITYGFLAMVKAYNHYVYNLGIKMDILTKNLRAGVITLCTIGIMITGQIALNSTLSLIVILPAALLCLAEWLRMLLGNRTKTTHVSLIP